MIVSFDTCILVVVIIIAGVVVNTLCKFII